jgi:hypothetical protein
MLYLLDTLVYANLFPLVKIQQRGLVDRMIQWLGMVQWWLC